MNKLDKKLKVLKQEKRLGLMTHVVVGYPSIEDTIRLVKTMERSGVDMVELQIPFSDPLADGSTIMKACETALKNGTKVKDSFSIMKTLAREVSIPLIFMAYYNTVFKYGVERFCKDAAEVGVSGLIIPDMPIEEENSEHLMKFCKKYRLDNIRVVSPASTDERLIKNSQVASGFVYATARQGITGARKNLEQSVDIYLKKLRKYFSIPIAVGFGISKKEHIESIASYADIAIVGSAVIDIINSSKSSELEKNVGSFIKSLKMVN